jgi:hypothetical protein
MMATAAPSGTGRSSQIVSILVVGCSLLIFLSFAIPYFEPPFAGLWYMTLLSGTTALLGLVAFRRREQGPIATIGLVCAAMAAALCVFTIVFPYAYGWAADTFMPN